MLDTGDWLEILCLWGWSILDGFGSLTKLWESLLCLWGWIILYGFGSLTGLWESLLCLCCRGGRHALRHRVGYCIALQVKIIILRVDNGFYVLMNPAYVAK